MQAFEISIEGEYSFSSITNIAIHYWLLKLMHGHVKDVKLYI